MIDDNKAREQLITELAQSPRQGSGACDADLHSEDALKAVQRSPAITIVWRAYDGWPIAFVSESVRRYGHTPQDLIGTAHHERYVAAEDLSTFVSAFADGVSAPHSRSLTREYRLLTRSGEKRWVRERLWVERDEGGVVTRFVGLLLDIDDLRQLEARVSEQSQRLSALFEHTSQPILLHDLAGRCIDANRAACDYLGYARDELEQMPLDTLLSPEAAVRVQRLARDATPSREAVMAGAFVARDGSRLPVVVECRVIETNGHRAILMRVQNERPCAPALAEPPARGEDLDALHRRIEELEGANRDLQQERDALAATVEGHLQRLQKSEVLLRDVHHRVKNNLQVIASLLGLQAEYIDDPKALEAFAESQSRVRAMALAHERIYQSSDLARVDLAAYVRDLAERLLVALGVDAGVALEVDVEPVTLPMDSAIPCGLLISELISNSIKHAFPEGRAGTISVGLRRDDDQIILTVADDGIGLPAGLDYRQTESLGLQLVTILAQQLDAAVDVDTSSGTRFRIAFHDHA